MFENGAGKAFVNDFAPFLKSGFAATDIFYKFDQALDNREKGGRGNKVHGDCQSNLVRLSNNFIPSFSPFSTFSPFPLSVLFLPLSTPSPFVGKRQKQHFCSF